MARPPTETPFLQRVRAAGLKSLTELRVALVHGSDSATVGRWSKSEMGIDPTVDALLTVAAMVAEDRRGAVWAPMPGVTRAAAPVVRLLVAFNHLGKAERTQAIQAVAASDSVSL